MKQHLSRWHAGLCACALVLLSVPTWAADKPDTPGMLVVKLPASAKLMIGSTATKLTGPERMFETPALKYGQSYTYTLKVIYTVNGKEMTAEKKVEIKAGETTKVELPEEEKPAPVVVEPKPVTKPVPTPIPEVKPEPKPAPTPEPKPDPKSSDPAKPAKQEPKNEPKPTSPVPPKVEPKTEAKPTPTPPTPPAVKVEVKPEPKPVPKPEEKKPDDKQSAAPAQSEQKVAKDRTFFFEL